MSGTKRSNNCLFSQPFVSSYKHFVGVLWPDSEFMRMSCCSRKTMVTSKDTRNYTGLSWSPTSSLRERSSACSSFECSEVLTLEYARRVEEVGEWRGTTRMKSWESVPLEGCPSYPYMEFGARPCTKSYVLPTSGREPKGGETSYLGLQGSPSCLDVSVRPSVAVIIVLCPHCGMGWRGAIVPVVAALLARWWFASHPMRCGLDHY
jgi:hypothetical protein